jgi:hypothetical protein
VKSSLLTKAALCICPPTVVATTVASVPPVRRAVHHLTQPARPHAPVKHAAPPCVPVSRRTLASPLPTTLSPDDVPVFTAITPPTGGTTYQPPINTPSFPGGPGGGTGGGTPPSGPNTPAVPEPSAWIMMVMGFGLIGAGVRQRHRYVLRNRTAAFAGGGNATVPVRGLGVLLGGGAISSAAMLSVGATPVLATAKLAQLGSKALNSSMLAKAALCVCPPVAMAVTTAALPPVRHAVYNATAPKTPPAMLSPAVATVPQPCVPVDVPTAAEAVKQGGDTLAVFRPTPSWPS